MSITSIGFIGLGVMGSAQCANLIRKSGVPVTVYDASPDAMNALVDAGATAAESAAHVAEACDVIFLSLPGGPQIEDVVLGSGGVLDALRVGSTIVDLSTMPVELAKRLGKEAEARGAGYVDAPVARTRQAAIDGTLSITVGTDDETFAAIKPFLDTMATEVTHCGSNGAGALLKILNNMVVFETVVALSEALTLIRRSGLVDEQKAFDALAMGSAASFTLESHGRTALLPDEHAEGRFPASYMLKDLSYALDLANDLDITTPAAELAHGLLQCVVDGGLGSSYHTAVIKVIEGELP